MGIGEWLSTGSLFTLKRAGGYMTPLTLSTLKTKAKTALRLSTSVFDTEIEDLINACVEDLQKRGALQSNQEDSLEPLFVRTVMTYVRAYFGQPENPELLIKIYNENKATMMSTTGYTDWGDD